MSRPRERLGIVSALLWTAVGLSIFLAACAITLISLWAHDEIDTVEFPEGSTQLEGIVGNPGGQDFLGIPDWNTNLIAYHAALMVGGYFVTQILAIISWSAFPCYPYTKIAHVFFLTVALGAVISGLVAVVRFKHQTQEAQLASVHSWLGVMAVIAFCGNYLFGLSMWGYKVLGPSPSINHPSPGLPSSTEQRVELRSLVDFRVDIHRALGASAFLFSAMTVVTGVMNQLVGNICENPASNGAYYLLLPDGCKVGNGLGVVVALSTITTLFCVLLRATWKREKKALAAGRTRERDQTVRQEEEETSTDVDQATFPGGLREKWLESERRKKGMLMYTSTGAIAADGGAGGQGDDKEAEKTARINTSVNPLRHLEVLI